MLDKLGANEEGEGEPGGEGGGKVGTSEHAASKYEGAK